MGQGRALHDLRPLADGDPGVDRDMGMQADAGTDLGVRPDDDVGPDPNPLPQRGAVIDQRRGMNAAVALRYRIEGAGDLRVGLIGLRRHQQRHPLWRSRSEVGMDHAGTGLGRGEGLHVPAVVEKGQIVGPGRIERRHVVELTCRIGRAAEFGLRDLRQAVQAKGPDIREKARIGH